MSENFEAPDQIIDQLVDTDPSETAEWQASFDAALANAGPVRARYLMLSLLKRAHEKILVCPHFAPLTTSTQFRQKMNQLFLEMKILNGVYAQ